MILNISGKEEFVDPPPAAIGLAVNALVNQPDEFFVLSDGDLSYVQGQWRGEGFEVAHQHGGINDHFACERPLDAGQVTGILQRYLVGETSWMHDYPWKHMPLDDLLEPASGMFPVGEFEGTALRRVLRGFEQKGIDFEAEPSGAGLRISVTHDCAEQARTILDQLFPQ